MLLIYNDYRWFNTLGNTFFKKILKTNYIYNNCTAALSYNKVFTQIYTYSSTTSFKTTMLFYIPKNFYNNITFLPTHVFSYTLYCMCRLVGLLQAKNYNNKSIYKFNKNSNTKKNNYAGIIQLV